MTEGICPWKAWRKAEADQGGRKSKTGDAGEEEGTGSKTREGRAGIMRKIAFDEEELLVLAVLEPDTRKNTIARLEEILPEVKDDPDMEAIVISADEKLKRITDEAFDLLGLEEYREELQAEDEEGAEE